MSKQTELVGLARTTNLDEVNLAYGAGALSNRNKIINGGFDVWQRSDNGYSGGGASYVSADRFKVTRSRLRKPNTNGNTGEENRGAVFDTTDGNVYSHYDYLVEDVGQKLNGKTMTFSFYAKLLSGSPSVYIENVGGDSLNIGGNLSIILTSNWKRYTFTGTVVSTGSGVQMPRIYLNDSGNANARKMQVDQFQLEVGDTATPFEHCSFGQVLALCQRYYHARTWAVSYDAILAPCWVNSPNQLQGMMPLPNTMRVNPTCSHNGAGNFRLNDSKGGDQICTNIIFSNPRTDYVLITWVKATSNMAQSTSGYINTEADLDATMAFDAEL
jgi:hypothetical protein